MNDRSIRVLMISGDTSVIRNIDGPFAQTLKGLSQYWNQIDVLCPGLSGHSRSFNNKVHLLGVRKFLLFIDLYKTLKKNKYDLIVAHDYGLMLNGLSAFFLAKLFKIPLISEIHHLEGFPLATSVKEKFYSFWGKIYIRLFVRRMTAVRIVSSSHILKLLHELQIPDSHILKLASIYLDFDLFKPLQIGKKYDLLFVGRLVSNKGILVILEAVHRLKSQGMALKLHLQGRGNLEQDIRNYIQNHDLSEQVFLDTSFKNDADLATLYNQARLLVCASSVEGGPRVTLEAMACNIPVLTTPCGIMPEVIVDGKNGFFFDGSTDTLVEKLKHIFMHPDLLSTLLREDVLQFKASDVIEKYAKNYVRIVNKNRSQ